MSNDREKKRKGLAEIFTALKDASAAYILGVLKSINGMKDLVLDCELIYSLEYIVKPQQLKACGVQKIFKLEPGSSPGQVPGCVYLIKSTAQNTRIVADHVKANRQSDNHKTFWIIFVPRRLYICDLILEREGVYGAVKMLEFPLGLIPVDSDMLSLEIPNFFTSYFLAKDQTHLYTVALSLIQLQKLCGPIPKIFGHGNCANMVIQMMKTMSHVEESPKEKCSITDLLIFDRDTDYASVLLSQLNYEGLLDETFDIKSGRISFGKEVTGEDQVLKLVLNDDDLIYSEIRNCHFTSVLEVLKNKAKELQVKRDSSELSIEDMRKIVAQKKKTAQQEKLLPIYINTCEIIIRQKNESNFQEQLTVESNMIEGVQFKEALSFVEEAINKQAPVCNSLRLLCLLSLTQDGLSTKDYNSLVGQFMQSYGHKHLITLQNLKKIGLLIEQLPVYKPLQPSSAGGAAASKIAGKVAAAVASLPRQSSFNAVSKKMLLVPSRDTKIDLKNPMDMSYVFGGAYIPIIAKLAEEVICNESFGKCEDALKLLPGPIICKKLPILGLLDRPKKTVLVYFLGGVSYAEIAALRLIGKIKDAEVIIATTSIINGNSLMSLLMPKDAL